MEDQLLAFKRFDPSLMVKEVHKMTESLVKIKAGTLSSEEFTINFETQLFHQDFNDNKDDYSDELYGEEYYEEDGNYGIDNHRFI